MKHFLLCLFFLSLGCTSHKCRESAEKLPPRMSADEIPSDASMSGRMDIMTSPGLTAEQKTLFLQVMNDTQARVLSIKRKEVELKSSLFRSLSTGDYNKKEVNLFKINIRKLEAEKMNLMFSSLEKVRTILGKDHEFNPNILHDFKNLDW